MKTKFHTHHNYFGVLLRAIQILRRYGLSTKKMESKLNQYVNILQEYGTASTFPITATILDRHPRIAQNLSENGVELAVHGYQHTDYSQLSEKELTEHFRKSVELFRKHNLAFSGFRFPYLKFNEKCTDILCKFPIKWESSHSIYWDVIGDAQFEKMKRKNYQGMLSQYDYRSSYDCISLPRYRGNLLEIPVSLPDDDLLERGGIKDNDLVKEIWGEILRQTHSRGELFALQLHPERIGLYKEALISIIKDARRLLPGVWISGMADICKWWREKEDFSVKVVHKSEGEFEVQASCSPRATLLVKSDGFGNKSFYNGFNIIEERQFILKSQKRPVIGIPRDSSQALLRLLENEGFVFEACEDKENYSIYLNNGRNCLEMDEAKVLGIIGSKNCALIRFWRWPERHKSALTITGDIDALTSIDFVSRLHR